MLEGSVMVKRKFDETGVEVFDPRESDIGSVTTKVIESGDCTLAVECLPSAQLPTALGNAPAEIIEEEVLNQETCPTEMFWQCMNAGRPPGRQSG